MNITNILANTYTYSNTPNRRILRISAIIIADFYQIQRLHKEYSLSLLHEY